MFIISTLYIVYTLYFNVLVGLMDMLWKFYGMDNTYAGKMWLRNLVLPVDFLVKLLAVEKLAYTFDLH